MPTLDPQNIRTLRQQHPDKRARDFADQFGLAEAQLLAAHVGQGVTRISADPDALFPRLTDLGTVMALTRIDACVHEKVGIYDKYHSGPHAAMVLNDDIDLRIFPKYWHTAFAVDQNGKRSIQVFDASGDAVHKIFLRDGSNHAAWETLVLELALADQSQNQPVSPRVPTEPAKSRPERADDLRADWQAMTDTHQFLSLVSRQKMNRLGAYRVAGAPFVRALAPSSIATLLDRLGETHVPVMIFVGNRGCIQIHSGPVTNIKPMGPWLNVLDQGFNLHLRGDKVAEVWEVRKPTRRGEALSVEAFDADGGLILQIFGHPKSDAPEAADWPKLVADLPDAKAVVCA